jgi:hypothetical protein
MHRAVVTDSGDVQWSELCYCQPPLQHERATVLDYHFDDLSTEAIDGHQRYDGKPFMDYLKETST